MEGVIITNKGKQLLAGLMSSNGTLKFTRVEIGTGVHGEEYNPESMETLLNYKMDGMMSKCKTEEGTALLTMQIISPENQEGFTATELGIFASEDREGAEEILYAYLDMAEDPQYIYANDGGAQKIVEITLEIIVANATDVKAEIAPNSIIFRDEFVEKEEELKGLIEAEAERARSAETKNAEDIEKVSSGLTSEINNKISDLIGGAPETLDTLKISIHTPTQGVTAKIIYFQQNTDFCLSNIHKLLCWFFYIT